MTSIEQARRVYPRARDTAGIASAEWQRMLDQRSGLRQLGVRDDRGQVRIIATLAKTVPFGDEDLLIYGPIYLRAAVQIAEEAFEVIRRQNAELAKLRAGIESLLQSLSESAAKPEPEPEPRTKDYAAECAMKCADAAFVRFLAEAKADGEILDGDAVAVFVRQLLQIKSRGELNKDPSAAERWRSLRAEFNAWMANP